MAGGGWGKKVHELMGNPMREIGLVVGLKQLWVLRERDFSHSQLSISHSSFENPVQLAATESHKLCQLSIHTRATRILSRWILSRKNGFWWKLINISIWDALELQPPEFTDTHYRISPGILPSSICRKFKLETLGWKGGEILVALPFLNFWRTDFLTANHQPSIHDGEELARSRVETQSHTNHWRNRILYSNIILHCCNSSSVACLLHIVLLPLELAFAKQKNMGGRYREGHAVE